MTTTRRRWWALAGLAWGCGGTPAPCGELAPSTVEPGAGGGGNVLVVLIDDIGVEQLAPYGIVNAVAPTPTIDCLCQRGVRFDRAWATPVCSPARAALYTGRLADKTTIGSNVGKYGAMPQEEVTIGEVAAGAGYATGFVGKWHLDGWLSERGMEGPRDQGFDVFTGTLDNLDSKESPDPKRGDTADYEHYWRVVDGELDWTTRYATTVEVDDALDFIDDHPEPWLLVLALHAAHVPVHEPPRHLLSHGLARDATDLEKIQAALEAADTELRRLLDGIDPTVLADTTVILAGDNGSAPSGVALDEDRVKATLYEGGIRVPLVVTGPHVAAPGVSNALVHLVDVMPTIAEILGAPPPADLDGVSFLGALADPDQAAAPAWVETMWMPPNVGLERAIRDDRFKLVVHASGGGELYDLDNDPHELDNLLWEPLAPDVQPGYDRLAAALADPAAVPREGGPVDER